MATNLIEDFGPTLNLAHNYIKNSQVHSTCLFVYIYGSTLGPFIVLINGYLLWKVIDDCPGDLNHWYRHTSKGAWPFSTTDNGWPVSDCTAQGLKVNSVIGITIKEIYFRCLEFCLWDSASINYVCIDQTIWVKCLAQVAFKTKGQCWEWQFANIYAHIANKV